jgi:ribose 5-phosphate isomerase A
LVDHFDHVVGGGDRLSFDLGDDVPDDHGNAAYFSLVADESKLYDALGEGPLPVETEPFGWRATMEALRSLGCEPELRRVKTQPFVTDGGHYTIDCRFPGGIPDPKSLESEIKEIPGALECGLFVGLAKALVVAGPDGVEVIGASGADAP